MSEIVKSKLQVKAKSNKNKVMTGEFSENSIKLIFSDISTLPILRVEKICGKGFSPSSDEVYYELGCLNALLNVNKARKSDIGIVKSAILRFLNRRDCGKYTDEYCEKIVYFKSGKHITVELFDYYVFDEDKLWL